MMGLRFLFSFLISRYAKFAKNTVELIQNRQNQRSNFINVVQWIKKRYSIKAKNAI